MEKKGKRGEFSESFRERKRGRSREVSEERRQGMFQSSLRGERSLEGEDTT